MLSRDGHEIKPAARFPVFLLAHTSRVNSQTLQNELGYQENRKRARRPRRVNEPFFEMRRGGRGLELIGLKLAVLELVQEHT
jgi:hypothetical protein